VRCAAHNNTRTDFGGLVGRGNRLTTSAYEASLLLLKQHPFRWTVTGAAGFIGSHLVERLLSLGQHVVGLDNFETGQRSNLEDILKNVGDDSARRFSFVEADICDLGACQDAIRGVDFVLHQAALGSVPRSIADPQRTNRANIDGFLNVLTAAKDANVKRFVYAASSSTYGDHPGLPKVEHLIGKPLSPYAVTKYVNELYADVFSRIYGIRCIGLRYFNVFGPRQDPMGAYAAVIPRWFEQLRRQVPPQINGDGETSRDFCFIENVVQANILAAMSEREDALDSVYNVAVGGRISLNQLYYSIRALLSEADVRIAEIEPVYAPFREGDVRHSQADIGRARELLGYNPTHSVEAGLALTSQWFLTTRN
jgi:UDP-N-acetylglucosamine/UDP-N-acetylgalactosamine 4-epimerase